MSLRIYIGSAILFLASVSFTGAWLAETALGTFGFALFGCTAVAWGLPFIVRGIRDCWRK